MNRHPEHFVLYGPVSISADYTQLSRNLMVRFLRTNRWSEEVARSTKAKKRFKLQQLSPALLKWVKEEGRSIEDVSAIISGVEPDGKGIPVLVKHYLKLKGSFVGFAVDPDFGNTLDGLIVVDIRNMENRQLLNDFGEQGRDRILASSEQLSGKFSQKPKTSPVEVSEFFVRIDEIPDSFFEFLNIRKSTLNFSAPNQNLITGDFECSAHFLIWF